MNDGVDVHALLPGLFQQFVKRMDVAESAERPLHRTGTKRRANGRKIRPMAGAFFASQHRLDVLADGLKIHHIFSALSIQLNHVNISAVDNVEQKIPFDIARQARSFEKHQDRADTHLRGRRCQQSAPVRLNAGPRDHAIGTGSYDVGHQIFQLAGFVSSESQTGLVISFYEEVHTQPGGEPLHRLEGRGEIAQATLRKAVQHAAHGVSRNQCFRHITSPRNRRDQPALSSRPLATRSDIGSTRSRTLMTGSPFGAACCRAT